MDTISNDFSINLFTWQTIILVSFGLFIYCLIDILKNKFAKNDKILWVLLVVLMPFLGALIYLFVGSKKKLKLNS